MERCAVEGVVVLGEDLVEVEAEERAEVDLMDVENANLTDKVAAIKGVVPRTIAFKVVTSKVETKSGWPHLT